MVSRIAIQFYSQKALSLKYKGGHRSVYFISEYDCFNLINIIVTCTLIKTIHILLQKLYWNAFCIDSSKNNNPNDNSKIPSGIGFYKTSETREYADTKE